MIDKDLGRPLTRQPAGGPWAAEIGECGYARAEWACREGGYLWDADSDGYDLSDCSYPCPRCNTREFLDSAAEGADGWQMYQNVYQSGAEKWRIAVEFRGGEELDRPCARLQRWHTLADPS
jgi:hypothetical protein